MTPPDFPIAMHCAWPAALTVHALPDGHFVVLHGFGPGKLTVSRTYLFRLTAIDANELRVAKPHTSRSRSWHAAPYQPQDDKQPGVDQNAVRTTAPGGGRIVVHQK